MTVIGDPTETPLLAAAEGAGLDIGRLRESAGLLKAGHFDRNGPDHLQLNCLGTFVRFTQLLLRGLIARNTHQFPITTRALLDLLGLSGSGRLATLAADKMSDTSWTA